MSKKEKRELNIRDNLKSVSLTDFEWLITSTAVSKKAGNHPKAKIGKTTYPYKRENPVKQAFTSKEFWK